jgi:adenine-specific DNA-methyltransferase
MNSPETDSQRLELQAQLDSQKTQEERNKLGQFATPSALAADILAYAKRLVSPRKRISFLDPAFGTGVFYSALLRAFPSERIASASAYEIDPHYGLPALELWHDTALRIHIEDFTRATAPTTDRGKANLLLCNPPYVRHHHLTKTEKLRLRSLLGQDLGHTVSGLAGLYCYFLLLSHNWLADGGIAGWLIPSEFMDVR